ncbi:MobQ family relaxase [Flexibacterium corallicola]|uniref:MobQ family relaxase n=1 Tax=Flexibacterium corallicola TaxID=3037259 RepID=UPI00286F91BF|nr:MobQ family relaxase [Pseudovibrio sp. M1P-2-3]
MAIYHLSVKTVSRSKGRSATAAAAYRSGTEIADERTGEVHDYSKKQGVEHCEIILPEGADPKFENREVLWNEAEKSEKRKNSTVAREYEVALPSELSPEERKELARTYGQWLAERHGVGVDVCVHAPNTEGDQRNHHAHILTTTRTIEGDQLTNKTRELDQKKSGAIEEVREKWADMVNDSLERSQSQERVDHRSFERQGREEVPSVHLGPEATGMERRGEQSERGNLNRLVTGLNRHLGAAKTYLVDIVQMAQERAEYVKKEAAKHGEEIKRAAAEKTTNALRQIEQARFAKREQYREALAGTGDLDKLWNERKLQRELEKRRELRQQKEQQRTSGHSRGPALER